MDWLFIAAVSVGIPLAVPPALRARWHVHHDDPDPDGPESNEPSAHDDEVTDRASAGQRRGRARWSNATFAGFALVAAGVVGLVLVGFDASWQLSLIAACTLGLAAGSVHPDLLDGIRRAARDATDA